VSTDPKNLVGKTLLGRYSVDAPLGHGGMGAVFVATQLSLGRKIALKVMKSVDAGDEAVKRFQRETQVIARMQHPNIVQVIDADRAEDGTLFLAMELLSGDTMRTILKRDGAQPLARVLHFAEDIASALVAAHAQGVIHRDLKPENVMVVRPEGRGEVCKVLDFGVAKLTSGTSTEKVTGSGYVAGTPGAIAPEQMMGKADDARSDLYALGVMMFELLSGKPPFSGETSVELLMRHLTEAPPRLSQVARESGIDIPAPVDELVMALLAKEPEKRPASASAFIDIVRNLREGTVPTLSSTPKPIPRAGIVSSPATAVVDLPPEDPTGDDDVLPAKKLESQHLTMPTPGPGSSPATVSTKTRVALLAARKRWKRITLMAACFGFVFVVGFVTLAMLSPEGTSPVVEHILGEADEAFWNLDVERAKALLDEANARDDNAVWAYIGVAHVALMTDASLVEIDRATEKALEVATEVSRYRERFGDILEPIVGPNHLKSFAEVLKEQDAVKARELFAKHRALNKCKETAPMEALIIAQRTTFAEPNPDVIEEVFSLAVEDNKPRPAAAYGLARAAMRRGDLKKARALLEDALTQAPDARPLHYAMFDVDIAEGKLDDAEKHIERYVAEGRPRAKVRQAVARVARKNEGDNIDPFNDIQGYLRTLPASAMRDRIDTMRELSLELVASGRLKEADALFDALFKGAEQEDWELAIEIAGVALFAAETHDAQDVTRKWRQRLTDTAKYRKVEGFTGERTIVFLLAADALAGMDDNADMEQAERAFKRLMAAKVDVPVVRDMVVWHMKKRTAPNELMAIANAMPACFREVKLVDAHLLSRTPENARDEDAAIARIIDDALATKHLKEACTTSSAIAARAKRCTSSERCGRRRTPS
jgi:serine/threonine protein kinase/tetratricopeptide (TPR) repeat protein